MVYLTARSTVNLCVATGGGGGGSSSSSSSIMVSGSPPTNTGTGSGAKLQNKNKPTDNESLTLKQKHQQRLYQSNWTLNYGADQQEDVNASMLDSSITQASSLLLLSPYSKSCYLMAQRSRQRLLKQQQQQEQKRIENQRLARLSLLNSASSATRSKSMLNLRNGKPDNCSSSINIITGLSSRTNSFCSSSSTSTSSEVSCQSESSMASSHRHHHQLISLINNGDDNQQHGKQHRNEDDNQRRRRRSNSRTTATIKRPLSLSINSIVTAIEDNQRITANNKIAITNNRNKQQILRAKHRASILWLIAKANDNGRIPSELRDPFYRDHQGQELLKPWITQRMANAELYGRALANIYGVPDYSSLSHQNIIQLLTRRGVFTDQLALAELGEHITETMLLKNCPVKLAAHMIIIECIMMLYIREILIPIKVMEVTTRFSGEETEIYTEPPPSTEPEDVALYWVNRACAQLNQEITREYLIARQQPDDDDVEYDPSNNDCPVVPSLEELSDMCDGCSLFALMAFYCPEHVDWREICLKPDISIADSIYNLQRIQNFCLELFPSDICFLSLEDFLYLPEPIVPNFLAFIADLLFMFEIQPVESVTPPYLRLYPELYQEDYHHPAYPQMLTPSEMKAKSLKSSWNNNSGHGHPQNDLLDNSSSGACTGSEYPPNHPVYDRPSYTMMMNHHPGRTASNMTLNYQHIQGSSRRNSINQNKSLNRRSSLVSNGSEQMVANHHHHHHEQSPSTADDEAIYSEPLNAEQPTTASSNQLSQYFSSMSINNSAGTPQANHHHHNHPYIDGQNDYMKNRQRGSIGGTGGHLTDYFSSLSNVNTNMDVPTHVRAQRGHPNNMDNVKQLLQLHDSTNNNATITGANSESQANSSDTSSVCADGSTSDQPIYSTNDVRAQLSEKRRQIEAERQNERQKRVSSDQNFRQEVFKTLKNIQQPDDSNDVTDYVKNQTVDEENLTFEIHELNPIRREKTFTSITGSTPQQSTKTSTFIRKNLFSPSEDLKASMSDLNYANAKDYYNTNSNNNSKTDKLLSNQKQTTPDTNTTSSTTTTETSSEPQAEPTSSTNDLGQHPEPDSILPTTTTAAPSQPQPQTTPSQSSAPPKRSQWGQPMIPLAGQIQSPQGQQPAAAHHYPAQPPAWSQTGYEQAHPPPPSWSYHHSPYHPHHPAATPTYSPYGPYGPPPPPPPPAMRNLYDPYNLYHHPHHMADPLLAYGHAPGMPTQATTSQQQIVPTSSSPSSAGIIPTTPTNSMLAITSPQQQPIAETAENIPEDETIQNTNISQTGGGVVKPAAHNETFFISFDSTDEPGKPERKRAPLRKSVHGDSFDQQQQSVKQTLTRTATQTLVSPSKNEEMDERIKELYNVRRPAPPPVPAVSFVIGAEPDDVMMNDDDLVDQTNIMQDSLITPGSQSGSMLFINGQIMTNGDDNGHQSLSSPQRPRTLSLNNSSKSEEEMARKKEAIMKQSLKRRALQESKRLQKEQELAVKREHERLKREQMERKKEEEREKRAAILEDYKRRKQLAEDIEKNGGMANLQGTVSRSSSNLILNRTPGQAGAQVTMRTQRTSVKQRPKSLHAALLDECQSALSTISGGSSSGRLSSSRDEIDDLMSTCGGGRLSSAASTTGVAGTGSGSSRPQSAMSSSQHHLACHSAVSTPTGSGVDHHHSLALALAAAGDSGSGPTSNTFYQEYTGPKLFVKPSQKSNKALILNAINVVLAGAVNADTNRRVTEVINKCDSKYYLILFRNSGLQYRAIYSYNPEREEVLKLDGTGPRNVHNDMIDKFYKYNSGTKSFTMIQTKHLCVTIDAFTIHNNLWMSKTKQQQMQSTPRRFLPC